MTDRSFLPNRLPRPWIPGQPDWVDAYHAAWATAARRGLRRAPAFASRRASVLDACFSENFFQWDSCFVALWARYSQGAFPELTPDPLSNLDLFYDSQDPDGAISREIRPNGTSAPNRTAAGDTPDTPPFWRSTAFSNPPLFSWAEWTYYTTTGDDSRLPRIYPHLVKYHDWTIAERRRTNGGFFNDSFGCGMDNLPRVEAVTWVDATAQMALDCECLAQMALFLDRETDARAFSARYLELQEFLNERCWDQFRECYVDLDEDDLWAGPMHVGAFWPLAAGVVPPERARRMALHLKTPRVFGRKHLVPSLAANSREFRSTGDYWRGGVWPPTTYMVIRGLARSGLRSEAVDVARNHVDAVAAVFRETGTFWENYAPDALAPGEPAKPDFCGWSALGPVAVLIETLLGLRVSGQLERLEWTPALEEAHGIENLRVGRATVDLKAERAGRGWRVTVSSDAPVEVLLHGAAGTHPVEFDGAGREIATLE